MYIGFTYTACQPNSCTTKRCHDMTSIYEEELDGVYTKGLTRPL